jgi:hypothetical protein
MNFAAIWFGMIGMFLFYGWLKELRFYKRRNWDFSEDSGITQAGWGGLGGPIRAFSPKTRVLVAAPLALILIFILTIVSQLNGFGA